MMVMLALLGALVAATLIQASAGEAPQPKPIRIKTKDKTNAEGK